MAAAAIFCGVIGPTPRAVNHQEAEKEWNQHAAGEMGRFALFCAAAAWEDEDTIRSDMTCSDVHTPFDLTRRFMANSGKVN